MRNAKKLVSLSIVLSVTAGCATRDNSDLLMFHTQTTILVEETTDAIKSAQSLAEMNLVESIAYDIEKQNLLESLVLKREDSFTLQTDSASIPAGLSRAEHSVDEAASALAVYTLLLAETSGRQNVAFELNAATEPFTGVLTSAISVLIEHGIAEHDTKKTCLAMQTAAPAVESLSEAMAALTLATANAVQATYADMAARRQRSIIEEGYPIETVMKLVQLNHDVTSLLENLETLHEAWITVPVIHTELIHSLTEESVSGTLRALSGRMNAIREGEE